MSLQSVARKLVAQTMAQIKLINSSGKGYLVNRRPLEDGSWIHCMVNTIGLKPIIRTWITSPLTSSSSGSITSQWYPKFYLESGFIIPPFVWKDHYLVFGTDENPIYVKDVKDAEFYHNERVAKWSNWDPEDIGFNNKPTGYEIVNRLQPLSLGYDDEYLTYEQAMLRLKKTSVYFGNENTYTDYLTQGVGSGTGTGKMVLYHRAKLGTKLSLISQDLLTGSDLPLIAAEARLQQERFKNTATEPGQKWGTHNCFGLYTDKNGDYWIMTVKQSKTVEFKKLFVWPQYKRLVKKHPQGSSQRLFVEAYALGYSQLTDITFEAQIEHDCPHDLDTYLFVAYSWHFNWDGSEAIAVGHHTDGSGETRKGLIFDLEARVLKMRITWDSVPHVTVETVETSKWVRTTDYSSDIIHVPVAFGGGKILMYPFNGKYINNNRLNYPAPDKTPVYAYYKTNGDTYINNIPQVVRYTRKREAKTEVEDCWHKHFGYYYCAGPHTGRGERFAGSSQKIGYYIGDLAVERSVEYTNHSTRWAEIENTDTWLYNESSGWTNYSKIPQTTAVGDCGCDTSYIEVGPDPEGRSIGFKSKWYVWQPTITKYQYERNPGLPDMALIIPSDCAEGVVIVSDCNTTIYDRINKYVDGPTPSWAYVDTEFSNGQQARIHFGTANFDLTVEQTVTVERESEILMLGRSGVIYHKKGLNKASAEYGRPPVDEPIPHAGYAHISMRLSEGEGFVVEPSDGFRLIESFGGEAFVSGSEKQVFRGFPDEFLYTVRPPEIIGSI